MKFFWLECVSPNSSLNLPQNAFGVAVTAATREEGGTDANAESDHRESGDSTLGP